ncbi:hypothetical protein K8O92_15615 [Nocardia asteroides]|nr:hypothetical protein K8O92_15615 [Nocardia asteroides]
MSSSQPLAWSESHDRFQHSAGAVGLAAAMLGRLGRVPADHAAVHARLAILADSTVCAPLDSPAATDRCRLGSALHSVVVHLRTVAERAHRHGVTTLADEIVEVIGIVEECGRGTARSFATTTDATWPARYRAEISRLADDADDAFRRLFARWYFDTDDLATVAGMREVGDELENVVRAFESVADAVTAMAAQPRGELPR